MPAIKLTKFGGIRPVLDPKQLPDNGAQTAENCIFESGRLEPTIGPTTIQSVTAGTKTIFPWSRGATPTTEWQTWTKDMNVVRGPVALDQYQRIYFTGDGKPKVRGYSGSTTYNYDLEIAKPSGGTVTKTQLFKPSDIRLVQGSDIYNSTNSSVWSVDGWSYGISFSGYCYHVPSGSFTVEIYSQGAWRACPCRIEAGSIGGVTAPDYALATLQGSWHYWGLPPGGAQPMTGWLSFWYIITVEPFFEVTLARQNYYAYAFVTAWGEVGPATIIEPIVKCEDGEYASLSALATSGFGTRNVTQKYIYRTITGNRDSEFRYIGAVPIATTTFTDNLADISAAEPMSLHQNPPETLAGLVVLSCGSLAGFTGKDVWFSDPFLPPQWFDKYRLTTEFNIVGLGVSGNNLIVATEGNPYVISGYHPSQMTMHKLAVEQSCVAAKGIVTLGNTVCYPSPDGYVAIDGYEGRLLTHGYYSKAEWTAMTPSTCLAGVFDRRVYLFITGKNLILDFSSDTLEITTNTDTATALYYDILTDTLYAVQGTNLVSLGTGTGKTATWAGKDYYWHAPVAFSAVRILADTYPVTLNLYANEVLVLTMSIADGNTRRLPVLRNEQRWYIGIVATGAVDEVIVASGMADIRK